MQTPRSREALKHCIWCAAFYNSHDTTSLKGLYNNANLPEAVAARKRATGHPFLLKFASRSHSNDHALVVFLHYIHLSAMEHA